MIATETKSSNELESSNGQKSAMTDGFHLIVDALKLNGIDTIYGVAGIPITDLARLAQTEGIRYIGFRESTRFMASREFRLRTWPDWRRPRE